MSSAASASGGSSASATSVDAASREPSALTARWLGRMPFGPALALQQELREAVIAGVAPNTLLLVEHPAVLTLGRRGDRTDVLWTDAQLRDRNVAVEETPRGGQVTLHAPGQLVAYPIVRIGRRIRGHLEDLGAVTVALLRELGCGGAEFRMETPGVFIATDAGDAKLASIGVHISRGVAIQGLSLNLSVEPGLFGALVSCGEQNLRMVSAKDLGATVGSVESSARRWAQLWAEQTCARLQWDDA